LKFQKYRNTETEKRAQSKAKQSKEALDEQLLCVESSQRCGRGAVRTFLYLLRHLVQLLGRNFLNLFVAKLWLDELVRSARGRDKRREL